MAGSIVAHIAVIKYSQPSTAVESGGLPGPEFELQQNYPNPFNPSTTISFTIHQSSLVNVRVFDVLGNEVATLVNERKEPGSFRVTWNAVDQPSGVYFCRLRAGLLTATKKLLLVR